eukprot:6359139-Prymnesium_polylepis.2
MLLKDVSASVSSAHVLAIMGPSGAGKTTLLNMLACEDAGGSPVGSVMLNGHPLTDALYSDHCAYVRQTDSLWPFMTTREHIEMAVSMYGKDADNVDFLVKAMGLASCKDVRVGGGSIKGGLSGGQKRRLSLAMALAKEPTVLFLDEPTSGLDAASAASIMDFLRVVAKTRNIAILCTIHQPSAAVFEGFDDLLVLAEGRAAYFGPAAELGEHLNSIGHAPDGANPSEVMLNLVNRDFTVDADVDKALEAGAARIGEPPKPKMTALPEIQGNAKGACTLAQIGTLTGKMLKQNVRIPIEFMARVIAVTILAT